MTNKFLIVGIVRNCSKHLLSEVARINSALSGFGNLSWFIVESDSTDKTVDVLDHISNIYKNFQYLSCGNLSLRIPVRTERLAFCRNLYLNYFRSNKPKQELDYVVVADFDGVNSNLTSDSIASCFERLEWDVCCANQAGPYYDIWALRHKIWNSGDCWKQFDFFENMGLKASLALEAAIYSKMLKIPQTHDWIEVDSAFGGLAIYRAHTLEADAFYEGLTPAGESVCEHVSLHSSLRSKNNKIFINPKLINSKYTEHSRNICLKKNTYALRRVARALIFRILQVLR
jgi:hypothetical protein